MSNNFFQFKQFKISQDQCAMKVSTDACIQGAWTPLQAEVKNVLDIGTGTGLLSLMLAQRKPDIAIDAIELETAACAQAKENIEESAWNSRIQVIQGDARTNNFNKKYDLIICNPPFFQNSLLGNTTERNVARHSLMLTYADIIRVIKRVLSPAGYTSVLLPYSELRYWEKLLKQNGMHSVQRLLIQPKRATTPNRVISICSENSNEAIADQSLVIYSENEGYTPEFTTFLSPFYLKL